MNSEDKNNATVDAILRRTMRESPGDAIADCPDAGVIAAYYDRSLAPSEREHFEKHFADCSRCQMQLAAIARADSEIVKARKRAPVVWLSGWRVAIPALAVAAALLIAIRFARNTEGQAEREQMVAMSKPEAPANAPATESLPSSSNAPENAPALPAVNELALNEPKRAPAIEERNAGFADRAKPLAKSERETVAGAEPPRESTRLSMGALAMHADTAAVAPPSGAPAANNSFGVAASAAGSAAASGSGAIAGRGMRAPAGYGLRGPEPGFNVIVSVDGSAWEIGPKGKIARSIDGGAFVAQSSGVTADLLAAAATSKDVCWIGGSAGTILRTIDGGTNWRKIASPTSDDISGIAASSADEVIVTTVNGKSFATSDGGASWHPQ